MPRSKEFVAAGLTVLLALLVGGVSPAGAAAVPGPERYTLEDVFGTPYPTDLVAASSAPRIAWVENELGVRNVWTAEGPDFEPVRLTDFGADDGQAIGNLALSADGSLLVFVRGGGPNSVGESPNPTSSIAQPRQVIWVARTAKGKARALRPGAAPVLAPGGDRLVYAAGGRVFSLGLEKATKRRRRGGSDSSDSTLLFSVRGAVSHLSYSPSGDALAFVSNRGDHSFIGTWKPGERRVRWIAPSVRRDSSPTWSPDGKRVAFLRMPGALVGELPDLTGATSFEIWRGDPATGEASRLWSSPDDAGGFAQFYPPQALVWAGADRLIFTSEHTGYLHAFSLPAEGGAPLDLTPGEAEIEAFTVSPDGGTVMVWANHGDIDRRHVWQVSAEGGPLRAVTEGEGIEAEPVWIGGSDLVAFRGASAREPMAIWVVSSEGGDRRRVSPVAWPKSFPLAELVVPEPVRFEAADGTAIHGQLFMPPAAARGDDRPAVVFLHGGPIRQMLLGWHYRGYYAHSYGFNQYLASRGYVVLAINFRTGIGYGRDFRRARNQGPRGASEYQDLLAAHAFLAARPEVDGEKIGLWGGSYGGFMTALGLARNSDLFAAGVDLHGVHDWSFRGESFPVPGGGWGLAGAEVLAEARESSPVAAVDKWRSPMLMVHGDDDRNVLFQQSTDLARRLEQRGVTVEILVFPDEVHGFLRWESWHRTFRHAADFFGRTLASGSAATAPRSAER